MELVCNGPNVRLVRVYPEAERMLTGFPSSSILYTQLIVTTSGVYALGFLKGILSFNAHITSLDASTGALIASQTVRSAVADVSKNILLLNNARLSPHALLVWVESGSIQIVNLTPELPNITPIVVGEIDEILNVQLNSFGMIVGLTKNKTSSVFALSGPEDGLRQIWEFKDSVSVWWQRATLEF